MNKRQCKQKPRRTAPATSNNKNSISINSALTDVCRLLLDSSLQQQPPTTPTANSSFTALPASSIPKTQAATPQTKASASSNYDAASSSKHSTACWFMQCHQQAVTHTARCQMLDATTATIPRTKTIKTTTATPSSSNSANNKQQHKNNSISNTESHSYSQRISTFDTSAAAATSTQSSASTLNLYFYYLVLYMSL